MASVHDSHSKIYSVYDIYWYLVGLPCSWPKYVARGADHAPEFCPEKVHESAHALHHTSIRQWIFFQKAVHQPTKAKVVSRKVDRVLNECLNEFELEYYYIFHFMFLIFSPQNVASKNSWNRLGDAFGWLGKPQHKVFTKWKINQAVDDWP